MELVKNKKYQVKYMPTKYLYDRCGIFKQKLGNSLIFWCDDDKEDFFNVQLKHLIDVNAITN